VAALLAIKHDLSPNLRYYIIFLLNVNETPEEGYYSLFTGVISVSLFGAFIATVLVADEAKIHRFWWRLTVLWKGGYRDVRENRFKMLWHKARNCCEKVVPDLLE